MAVSSTMDVASPDDDALGRSTTGSGADWGRSVLLVVFVVGLVVRLAVVVLPERLLLRITIDDAFYYLRVAQEVGVGNGSTFDGLSPTNGYHPLWLLIITPVVAITGPGTGAVRAIALLQASLAAVTFVIVARMLLRKLSAAAVALGLAVWWLAPLSVLSALSGVEASVACLLVVLLVGAAIRYVDEPTGAAAAVVGGLSGLTFLARSDAAFAVLAVAVWVLLQVRRRPDARTLPHAGLAALAGVVTVAPWLVWNQIRFGTIEQASTRARPMVLWELATGESRPRLDDSVRSAASYVVDDWPRVLGWAPLLAFAALLAGCWAVKRYGFPDGPARRLAVLGALLTVSGTLMATFHAGVRLLAREYYFEWVRLSVGLLVAAVVSGLSVAVVRSTPPSRRSALHRRLELGICAGALAVLLVGTVATTRKLADPPFGWQSSMAEGGRWLEDNTDEGERVLSFNAGLLGYYSQRHVINLDGVINNDALAALEERQLASYMCDSGANWYVDFEPVTLAEYQPFLGDDEQRLQFEHVVTIRGEGASPNGSSELEVFRFSCSEGD